MVSILFSSFYSSHLFQSILGFGSRAATDQADVNRGGKFLHGQYGDLISQTEELRDEKIKEDLD